MQHLLTRRNDESTGRWPSVPPALDIVLAGAFVVLTLSEVLFSPGVRSPAVHLLVAGIALAALAWRRQYPLTVAALVIVATVVTNPRDEFSTLLALVLVSYTVGSETDRPRSHVGLAILLVPFMAGMVAEGLEPSDVAAALVFLVGPWVVGTALRQRTIRARDAIARADRLEREQEAQAAAAVARERTRIARELHDIVSHSLSVVTIQTQAVRRRLGPEQSAEASDLAAVEATARDALAEMRRLFGVLRNDGEIASLAPQPGLGELDRLLAQVRASGMSVEVDVDGEPYVLPPGVDLAAYRIVQQGLTNALQHSTATGAAVRLRYGPRALSVEVEDDGHGMAEPSDGGHGLVGIRERVALYGGTLDLSPGPKGGVRLVASLPVVESP